jgi:hypothetical protein
MPVAGTGRLAKLTETAPGRAERTSCPASPQKRLAGLTCGQVPRESAGERADCHGSHVQPVRT